MRKKLLVILFSVFTVFVLASNNVFAEEHNHTGWINWGDNQSEWTSLPSGAGSYYLTHDVILSSTWNVPEGATNLCLNGHVIKADTSENDFCVITIQSGATLNLYDCDTTTVHNGYVDANGLWHLDEANEHNGLADEKDITGGIITGGTAVYGGGVYVNSGTFNMYGGSITNNKAQYGGGMDVTGTFNMYGGVITNNYASQGGGGINLNGTFNMYGGEITNNETANAKNGGGVYVNDGTFTMTDGTITSNEAGHGGGIFVASNAQTNITNGIIENNHTTASGAGVQVDGSFTMTGGTIKNNSANNDGGGLSINGNTGMATLAGNTEIINNTANGKGGGVSYYNASDKVILGGSVRITGNVVGGTINNGTLTDGTANNVYLFNDNLVAIGTKSASNEGNGVAAPTGDFKVGVTTATTPTETAPVKITTNGTASDVQHFFSDNENYKISFNSGTVASGDEYLELKVITIADILATVDGGFPESQETSWKNNTNKNAISFVYPASSALYFKDSIKAAGEIVTNNVEKEGNNYKFVDSSIGTITFNMTNNKLTSLTFEHSTSAFIDYSSLDGTYAPVVEYEITDGNKTIINIDKSEDVLFTSTADYNKFYNPDSGIIGKVLVDNELVEPTNYVSAEGSTKVTLKASYLSTLSVGQHTIDIISTDGHASTTFTITKNNPSPNPRYDIPNTGVDGTYSNNHSLLKLSSLSLLAIGTYMVIKKKKNN